MPAPQQSAPARPLVAASVVTYHTDTVELDTCLKCLIASGVVGRIDVVDNASDPAVKAVCERAGAMVHYLPNPNMGYGAGHNVALRRTLDGDLPYHLVLNSDVVFDPKDLVEMVGYLQDHPAAGQLIPHTVFPDGKMQFVVHPLPTPYDLIGRRFLPEFLFRERRRSFELRGYTSLEPLNVPFHHGCFMLLRTAALRRCGLFDERYFMYAEDIDLTRRIHRFYETIYYPGVTIVHSKHAASRKSLRMLWVHSRNILRYFAKWGFFNDPERRRINRALAERLRRAQ